MSQDEDIRRALRQEVLYNAVLAHSDVSMMFHEPMQVEEILKTADQFYDWVCRENEQAVQDRWEEFRDKVALDEAQGFKMTLDHWPVPQNLDPDTPSV